MPQSPGHSDLLPCRRRWPGGTSAICLAVLVMAALNGCAGLRSMMPGRKVACVLPPNPTKEQVVEYVNANVEKVHGYRASSLRIRANNLPLSGNLVVERGRRLHLQVTSLVGPEVDLGSNDEVFWIWAKRNEPAGVYYAAHTDMDVARQNLPIPFEPEWLMEALGVAPLSANDVEMETQPGGPVRLVSHHDMPSGERIRKVIVVDPCRGQIIEHSTYNAQGQPLVRALIQDYRLDPVTGAMIARHIKLDWPQAEMSLAMDLGNIEVNPASMPASVWAMPQVPGCPMVDLGRRRSGDPMIAAQPGKARITDDPPAFTPSKPLQMAYTPQDDEFRAPDVTDRNGPVVLEEPIFFEPPVLEPDRGPISTSMPTLSPF